MTVWCHVASKKFMTAWPMPVRFCKERGCSYEPQRQQELQMISLDPAVIVAILVGAVTARCIIEAFKQ
jgi:hypothetical protein